MQQEEIHLDAPIRSHGRSYIHCHIVDVNHLNGHILVVKIEIWLLKHDDVEIVAFRFLYSEPWVRVRGISSWRKIHHACRLQVHLSFFHVIRRLSVYWILAMTFSSALLVAARFVGSKCRDCAIPNVVYQYETIKFLVLKGTIDVNAKKSRVCMEGMWQFSGNLGVAHRRCHARNAPTPAPAAKQPELESWSWNCRSVMMIHTYMCV